MNAVHEGALAASAHQVQGPVRNEDVEKRGGVHDVNGITRWMVTTVE